MIPQSYIDAWRSEAPWSSDLQVEQDLVLARAIAELFGDERARELLAMRGGTVLNKFYFSGHARLLILVCMDITPSALYWLQKIASNVI